MELFNKIKQNKTIICKHPKPMATRLQSQETDYRRPDDKLCLCNDGFTREGEYSLYQKRLCWVFFNLIIGQI